MDLIRTLFFFLLIFIHHTRTSNARVNHCCPPGQAVLMRNHVCWNPETNVTSSLALNCTEHIRILNYTITDDLNLSFSIQGNNYETFDTFCLGNVTRIKDVALEYIKEVAFLCVDQEIPESIDGAILGYCMIVSIIFLVPTALIYSALPELRDVQGKSIINFCISLGIGQGILVMMKLMEYSDMALCATRGFLVYFFIIAAFFWTNAISIQVLLNTRRPATLDYSWHEFKWYFVYAWGLPTILTVCMAIVNFHPGDHRKPGIGLNHCWFYNKEQQWYYMYSVMTLLLAANIGIFIYVTIVIWRLSFSSSHVRALKFKLVMTVRLIFLMGLPWLFEMIGSLAGEHIIWSILDVINTLQGILIFLLLVVFRRRVIKLMYRHGWLDCISVFVEKHLAVEDDEENVVQHTDVPMSMSGTMVT